MRTRTILTAVALLAAGALQSAPTARTADDTLPANLTEQEAYEIARDAYVYGYPLLLSDVTLRQQTNFAEPTGKLAQAPLNQFSHAREFTPADWKVVVRPNVDTEWCHDTRVSDRSISQAIRIG
jgi:hypothetical protein